MLSTFFASELRYFWINPSSNSPPDVSPDDDQAYRKSLKAGLSKNHDQVTKDEANGPRILRIGRILADQSQQKAASICRLCGIRGPFASSDYHYAHFGGALF